MNITTFGLGSLALLLTALAACSGSNADAVGVAGTGGSANQSGGTSQGSSNSPTGGKAAGGGASTATAGTASQGGVSGAAIGGKASQGGNSSAAAGGKPSQGGNQARGGAAAAAGASSTAGGNATVAADCRKEADGKTTLVFVNGCAQGVSYRGSDIAGGTLAPGAFVCVDVGTATEAISSKRYWGFTGDDPGAEHYTLAEFTFNTDFYDLDWYNISHVDAHNLPMAILPSARPKCRNLNCPQDFLASCPAVGQYRDGSGEVVSCVSPNRNDPNSPIALLFEQCDDAYAWSGDDQQGSDVSPMLGCQVEDFDIVFCPGAP